MPDDALDIAKEIPALARELSGTIALLYEPRYRKAPWCILLDDCQLTKACLSVEEALRLAREEVEKLEKPYCEEEDEEARNG